jgi:hypothetical protein
MDWIAEIKLNQRGDPGRYGMHHRGTANLDLTLDVEANELCEARSGPEETAAVHGPAPFLESRACRLLCQAGIMPSKGFPLRDFCDQDVWPLVALMRV